MLIQIKRLDDDDGIIIALYNTGIKVTNRGQWMQEKWQVKKKGYLKIHIAVVNDTKEILALEVTDEKVHDGSKIMPELVEYILKRRINNNIKIKSALGDGYYDSNENFKYLQKKRIWPGIKVRKNSIIISLTNNSLRNRKVNYHSKDLLKWKKRRKFGSRWIAKTVFHHKENLWRICICNKISKYVKGADFKSIFV